MILKMRDIRKAFQGVKALDGAGLTLRTGEVSRADGRERRGQKPLIKVLTGVHAPDGGVIEFDGRQPNKIMHLIAHH